MSNIHFVNQSWRRGVLDQSSGVERDLYLFYIPYKLYIDIVSVLRCIVKNA